MEKQALQLSVPQLIKHWGAQRLQSLDNIDEITGEMCAFVRSLERKALTQINSDFIKSTKDKNMRF